MQTSFKVRDRGPAMVVARRAAVTLETIGATISTGLGEVYGGLAATRALVGPPFVIYHEAPHASGRPFQIEICAPAARPVEPPPGWTRQDLPAGRFASVVHVGPYEALGSAYEKLTEWIARQGLSVAGPPREVYLSEPGTPPAEIRTVIEFPVATSSAAMPVGIAGTS